MKALLSKAVGGPESLVLEDVPEPVAKPGQAVVAVKDSGLGVSREDLAVLFSKFKQLKSFDRTKKGTGLGLVVSRGIVEAHHGKIWAESAGENLGSTFSFSLPLP